MTRKALLVCGVLSSLLYVAMTILVAMQWEDYSSVSQTVSELSAIGAPTRELWVLLGVVYSVLITAFGWGVWRTARQSPRLRVVGRLLVVQGLMGFVWPPMHQRAVLAAGGGTLTDTMHIAWAIATVLLMLLAIGFASGALGTRFRIYSFATLLIFAVCGVLTGLDGPRIATNLPTPWIGVWERINIGAFMLWVVILAATLLRARDSSAVEGLPQPGRRERTTIGFRASPAAGVRSRL